MKYIFYIIIIKKKIVISKTFESLRFENKQECGSDRAMGREEEGREGEGILFQRQQKKR